MSNDSWTCLFVENGTGLIDDAVRNVLKRAACELHLKRLDKMHIVSSVVDGIITTSWLTRMVGTRSGVLFRAEFDSPKAQNYKVNFLLSEEDLQRGAYLIKRWEENPTNWVDGYGQLPVEELYQFYDLRAPQKRLN